MQGYFLLAGFVGACVLAALIVTVLFELQYIVDKHTHEATLGWPVRQDSHFAKCQHGNCAAWIKVNTRG